MDSKALFDFLVSLPQHVGAQKNLSEVDFVENHVGTLMDLLGVPRHHVFYEYRIRGPRRLTADVVVADGRVATPRLVLEVKVRRHGFSERWLNDCFEQMGLYLSATAAPLGILLAPDLLALMNPSAGNTPAHQVYRLAQLTEQQADAIMKAVARALREQPRAHAPAEDAVQSPAWPELETALKAARGADDNDSKGRAYEDMAALLLASMDCITVRYRNLHTATSEIDLIARYEGASRRTFFDSCGEYLLIECKNWAAPAGAKVLRDFAGKMDDCDVSLGIFLSRMGVTGQSHGEDALGVIRNLWHQHRRVILVVSEEDIDGLRDPGAWYDVLLARYERVRFQIR